MFGGSGNPDTLVGTRGGRLHVQEASHTEQFLDCVVTVRRIVGALTNQEAASGPSQNGYRRDAQEDHGCVGPCHADRRRRDQQHAAGEHEDRHRTRLLFDLWLPLPGGVGIQAGGDQFRPGLDRVLGISPLPLGGSLDRSAAGAAIHASPEDLTSY